jgi:hypothetical protein
MQNQQNTLQPYRALDAPRNYTEFASSRKNATQE